MISGLPKNLSPGDTMQLTLEFQVAEATVFNSAEEIFDFYSNSECVYRTVKTFTYPYWGIFGPEIESRRVYHGRRRK